MNRISRSKFYYFLIPVFVAILAPAFVKNEYYLHIFIRVFLNILIASGLYLIMTTGLVSFCHSAFMAIGGYASALIVMKLGLNTWASLLGALCLVLAVAFLFGSILLRLKGTYFFIGTFALGELVILAFSQTEHPFGGWGGLMNIPLPDPIPILGFWTIEFASKTSFYNLALIFLLVPLWLVYRLENSRIGAIWTAIQQADQLAQSVGINVMFYKVLAFMIGSSMAALGGIFLAHYSSHLNPAQFDAFQLMNYLTFVMVGGNRKLLGPVVGATLLTLFGDFLSLYQSVALFQTIIYGMVLILVLLFLPGGIISLIDRRFSRGAGE